MEAIMLTISVALVSLITGYVFGRGRSYFSEEDGFYIFDARDPEKNTITLDLHRDLEEILKKRYAVFRVVEKKNDI